MATELKGPRFRRISWVNPDVHPELHENRPHLKQLFHTYDADYYKDERKYGQYTDVQLPPFSSPFYAETEPQSPETEAQSPRTEEASTPKDSSKLGPSPLHAYEPVFNWETERAKIHGYRQPQSDFQCTGLKVGIKVLQLKLQAGLSEPIYGTLSLYHWERKEKLSENVYFRVLPDDDMVEFQKLAVFTLDRESAAICLLIQLEKHATEENGVKASFYARKTEMEKQRLQEWVQIMPLKEPFAWAAVPLFDRSITSSDGKHQTGNKKNRHLNIVTPGVIEITEFKRVDESYIEESLQDPKRKHRPVKATMRLQIEHLEPEAFDVEMTSLCEENGSDVKPGYFRALDFRQFTKNVPFKQLSHTLFVYPMSVSLGKRQNIFVRVELRTDSDPLKAFYPRHSSSALQAWEDTQVAVNAKTAYFHDELKVLLPAVTTPQHHLRFTFFKVDLSTKSEASPQPLVIGYSVLQLVHISSVSGARLPIFKLLDPTNNFQENQLVYVEDALFKLRLRLCSSVLPTNEPMRDLFIEFDKYRLGPSNAAFELIESINNMKDVDATSMLQFLHPTLNMLLHLISDNSQALQAAGFRAMVNLLTRVHQESSYGSERNPHVVEYIDFLFDDFGGQRSPVYLGLCKAWGCLLESKEKGYNVGKVYEDALYMSWAFLELVARSLALEQARMFPDDLPTDEDAPPRQLTDEAFQGISNLYSFLVSEVYKRCKNEPGLAKQLNSSLAYFCYDMLSVVDPRQVFELVALYIHKFDGASLQECKLTFLRIVCDHDMFIELPGRDPSQRNYLASMFIEEICCALDSTERSKAARFLVVLTCKHEYDSRYQNDEDKLYIAQLYFQLVEKILDQMTVFFTLNPTQMRQVLICVLQIIRYVDHATLINAWQRSVYQTKLFFKLVKECTGLFEAHDPSLELESPDCQYSDKLSPAVHTFFKEASQQESKAYVLTSWMQPGIQPENGHWYKKATPLPSPSRTVSSLRESLQPMLLETLELWEDNLSTSVGLQVLEIIDKFSYAVADHSVQTDYERLDCITTVLSGFLQRHQPPTFWKAFLPIFNKLCTRHGSILLGRENGSFLKLIAFQLLRLAVSQNKYMRRRAVLGLQILLRTFIHHFKNTSRLHVILTIALSELVLEVPITQARPDGGLEESDEARLLKLSLRELPLQEVTPRLLKCCDLPDDFLDAVRWEKVQEISAVLLQALCANIENSLLIPSTNGYAAAENLYALAMAYSEVPDLQIIWLQHLCDLHQEMQSWAEAAQCAVAMAGIIMQALVSNGNRIWKRDNIEAMVKICPMLSKGVAMEVSSADVEGYGASKLTLESAVRYLQLGNSLFSQAEHFHFCAMIQEQILPVHKSRKAFKDLETCHASLRGIYESIVLRESSLLPFIDATYYRVGFYGERFGKLDRKVYIYREPKDIRLGDMMEKLKQAYGGGSDDQPMNIIPDSREVNPEELDKGACYLQITSVDPLDEDEGRPTRKKQQAPGQSSACVFNHFVFDTPFTKKGQSTQGGLDDQWKRRTILETQGSFPGLLNRLPVIKSESTEYSPIENAIEMVEARTVALGNEIESLQGSSRQVSEDPIQAFRLRGLQRILQGSIFPQVNGGVIEVCSAFLSRDLVTSFDGQELQQLISTLREFMHVCKEALQIHETLIGEGDELHSLLVSNFQLLAAELTPYIPAILSELTER